MINAHFDAKCDYKMACNMTQWHKDMQDMFPTSNQEVRFYFTHVSANDEVTEWSRRADVCVDDTVHQMLSGKLVFEMKNVRRRSKYIRC